jgi:choline-sulfatase
VFTNEGALGNDQATFLHSLAAEGYETVLVGRMHFLGENQRHGFTKRLVGDLTPLYWGRYGPARKDLGPYVGTMAHQSLKIIGGGTSPVLEYDKAVVRAALDYLSRDYDKPQCVVVGIYGPHHTFVAPPDRYLYYKERVDLPPTYTDDIDHPILRGLRDAGLNRDNLRKLRAAYLGMIETVDEHVGAVWEAWNRYLARSGRQGVFLYMSDHGEQAGEHGLIGKHTFYEGSARIPMIAAGDGIPAGHKLTQLISIMDIGPTLCEWAGAEAPPRQDGASILRQLRGGGQDADRMVTSELVFAQSGRVIPARMLRWDRWKYVAYAGCEAANQLFDLQDDPLETRNLHAERPDIVRKFQAALRESWNPAAVAECYTAKAEHYALLRKWGRATDVPEPER